MTNFTMLIRDRSRLTKQALRSLQRAGLEDMNITILDDRSEQETRNIVQGWVAPYSSHASVVHQTDPTGTGHNRNRVISLSEATYGRGKYLYLSDSDVAFVAYGWLPLLIKCYEFAWARGYRIVGGYNHPFHQPVSRDVMDSQFCVYQVHALATQSMLMRWEVWDEFGPFCETPVDKVCQSEDVEISNRINAAGFKVGVVSPWVVANTGITNTFGQPIPGWELVKSQCPEGIICE